MADKCVTAVFFLASVFLFASHVDASQGTTSFIAESCSVSVNTAAADLP